ncbi:MAG TPA: chorismate-binding protein, partial [Limnochorda sp.]
MLQAHAGCEEGAAAGQATAALDVDNESLAGKTAGELEATLARWLRDAARLAARRGEAVLASLVTPIEPQDPLRVFERARALGQRFFWSDGRPENPARRLTLVGAGEIHRVEGDGARRFQAVGAGWAALRERTWVEGPQVAGTGPVFLGGFAFDPEPPESPSKALGPAAAGPIRGALGGEGPSPWEAFPAALMRVPELLLTGQGRAFWLTVNAWVGPGRDVQELAGRLARGVTRFVREEPAGTDRAVQPSRSAAGAPQVLDGDPDPWYEAVAQAAEAVRNGLVAKVVLARPQRVRLPDAVAPDRVLAALAAQNPRATLFCLELGESAFLGATPEHLAQVAGGWVESMALAGSAPRGTSPDEDERLGRELLSSPKNREEHRIVVDAVREALEPLTSHLDVAPEPGLLKLPTIQHLFTP